MKKIYVVIIGFLLILTACTNGDIPIIYSTNLKIIPAGVIKPFTYEMIDGDLQSPPDGHKLRVRLFIYDDQGQLELQETRYLSTYAEIMNSTLNLQAGSYTAIVVTDVVEYGNSVSFEYWLLSGEENFTTLEITDAGVIRSNAKTLGLSAIDFNVDDSSPTDYTINVSPAGALCCIVVKGIHDSFTPSVTSPSLYAKMFELVIDKLCKSLKFNSQEEWTTSLNNNLDRFRLFAIMPIDFPQSNAIYGYSFIIPTGEIDLYFDVTMSSSDYSLHTDNMTITPQMGDEYYFELDMTNLTCGYQLVNDTKSTFTPTTRSEVPASADKHTFLIKDLVK